MWPLLWLLLLQIVMSAHKELALDEKSYHVRFGSTCVTGYGPLMRTTDYASFDEFYAALQETWQQLWQEVFSADPAGKQNTVLQLEQVIKPRTHACSHSHSQHGLLARLVLYATFEPEVALAQSAAAVAHACCTCSVRPTCAIGCAACCTPQRCRSWSSARLQAFPTRFS
jgi:hypothetical protein